MAPKPRMRIEHRFPAVKKGMYETVEVARRYALNVGEDEAEKRIERTNDSRGYNLPGDIEQERIGFQSGRIWHPDWFMRFFEYGTVYIPPAPFMRPASRKMWAAFIGTFESDAPQRIRRRVGRVK